ncbi:MAG: homoprotocatechuate degradation operon regulator HpaR [Hyphomicrobiales bacterium]|nr:MAG: homoprotocatechuate degradation operon regulator HpaR [Hyphomicrobiales bacterium]
MTEFRPILARHGFTEQQWRVLRILIEMKSLDATALSERTCILAPSLTRIIRNLESRGLLQKDISEMDARKLVLKPTRQALEISKKVTPETNKVFEEIEKQFGAENNEKLLDMLQDLCNSNKLANT